MVPTPQMKIVNHTTPPFAYLPIPAKVTSIGNQQNSFRFDFPGISAADLELTDQPERVALLVITEVLGTNVSKLTLCLHK